MIKRAEIKRIIVSRTDAIGDVILTLPLCGLIKKYYPNSTIIFLGKTYTKPVIECCGNVDEFVNADDLFKLNNKDLTAELKNLNADIFIHVFPNRRLTRLTKKAKIKHRIGTTNRLFHWGKINNLVFLSRKKSALHEAQLNCKLLEPLDIYETPTLKELANFTDFSKIPFINKSADGLLDKRKINVILHPKSNASAREWSLENYRWLIQLLPADKYKIFISGTEKEKLELHKWITSLPEHVIDITGKFSLAEFISFISKADYLVAASTGPLHIASACGIGAIGIYPPIKPMHPGRWSPIGKNAHAVCIEKSCLACKGNPHACKCINEVSATTVASYIK
jgi:heptosyltransferase-3